MATPRKHWFRVADAILREPITVEQRGILVSLMAWLNQRWARDGLSTEQACQAVLHQAALAEITGRSQLKHSRSALSVLGQCYSIAIQVRGELTEISWPKFAEFQELPSANSPRVARELPSPRRPLPLPRRRKTQDSVEQTPAAPATTDTAIGLHAPLTDPQWTELRAWADAAIAAGKLTEKASDPAWLQDQIERCADHWAAKGKKIIRAPAAVRNWIRRAEEFRARDAPAALQQQGMLAAFVARGANGGRRL